MFRALNALMILAAALAITARSQQPGQPSKTWAVVVGISRYQKLPGGQQLQFADRDAALFAESIQKRGVGTYNIRLLTGAEATVSAIKSAIGTWLARSVSPSDTVIFFFSGHGLFEKEFGESYLLGVDSDAKDPFGTALAIDEVRQAVTRIRAAHVLILVDAVRRDFFDPETDPGSAKSFVQAFDQLTAARHGLSAIIASGPGEFSREGQRWGGHGVFARHLADVLGEDGTQANEIFEALAARVSADTSNKQHVWKSGAPLDQVAIVRVGTRMQTAVPAPSAQIEASSQKKPATEDVSLPTTTHQEAPQSNRAQKSSVGERADSTRGVVSAPKNQSVQAQGGQKPEQPVLAPPTKAGTAQPSPANRENSRAQIAPERGRGATESGRNPSTSENAGLIARGSTEPPAPRPSVAPQPKPPSTAPVRGSQPQPPTVENARAEVPATEVSPAPKPTVNPPTAVAVSPERAGIQPREVSASVPTARPDAAPSPTVLQLEAAIRSKRLVEPRNSSAWDLYQRLALEPGASADVSRLKPVLAAALGDEGRAIVSGDVRGDNISDRVDDFKRAGQMLARARALAPESGDVIALEKLSAAEALISLQFYDEAERALGQLQGAKLAAIENALGLVYQGKLDTWRAERAFKRAIDLDSKWAAPHYNLALLYRSQQNPAALSELEAAASLDPNNVDLIAALGEEYFTRQQFKQATEAYRKAVVLKPSDDNLHTKLGHALYSQGLQDEANREYQKALELRRRQD